MSYNYNIYKELDATKQSICASLNEVKNKMPLPNEYEKQITKLTNDVKALKDVSNRKDAIIADLMETVDKCIDYIKTIEEAKIKQSSMPTHNWADGSVIRIARIEIPAFTIYYTYQDEELSR